MTEEEDEEENGEYWEVNQIINQVDLSEIEERREIPDWIWERVPRLWDGDYRRPKQGMRELG